MTMVWVLRETERPFVWGAETKLWVHGGMWPSKFEWKVGVGTHRPFGDSFLGLHTHVGLLQFQNSSTYCRDTRAGWWFIASHLKISTFQNFRSSVTLLYQNSTGRLLARIGGPNSTKEKKPLKQRWAILSIAKIHIIQDNGLNYYSNV